MLGNDEVVGPRPPVAATEQVQAVHNVVGCDSGSRALPDAAGRGGGVNVDFRGRIQDLHQVGRQEFGVWVAGPATEELQVTSKLWGPIIITPYIIIAL